MRINRIGIYFFLLVVFSFTIIFEACKHKEETPINNEKYKITLKWNKAYELQTKQDVETGFIWALSFLGAELPKGCKADGLVWNANIVEVDFYRLGFNSLALEAISKLLNIFKQSEEFKKNGAIDIGRFLALTLNSSNHYYAITGIARTLDGFKKDKILDSKQFVVTNSAISTHNRIIVLPDSTNFNFLKDAFIAKEGNGNLNDDNFRITSFEVFDQMKNGQFRFAIYDTLGMINSAAMGKAGKPAKCLWCHEIFFQPLYFEQVEIPGFYNSSQFLKIINSNSLALSVYRNNLSSEIDFTKKQDHTFTELLYISFMEPNAERIALEWEMSIDSVKEKLKGLPTHLHSEFEYLGNLFEREEVDKLAPYLSIRPPSSAREKSSYEPDLIK